MRVRQSVGAKTPSEPPVPLPAQPLNPGWVRYSTFTFPQFDERRLKTDLRRSFLENCKQGATAYTDELRCEAGVASDTQTDMTNTVSDVTKAYSRWQVIDEQWPRMRACVESLTDDRVWWRPNEATWSIISACATARFSTSRSSCREPISGSIASWTPRDGGPENRGYDG